MFHLVNIEKIVRIEPYELGKNLELKIRKKYTASFNIMIIW
jgi:DNA-directed RNA polymerase subunit E'/Rpb7